MADTTDTRPGVVPADLKTGSDGSVPDLSGRRAWIWCRNETGGRADFRSDRLEAARRLGFQPVPNYPIHFGRSARTPKARAGDGPADTTAPTGPAEVDPGPPPVPASALGAVEPADDRQPDAEPPPAPDDPPAAVDAPVGDAVDEPAGDAGDATTTPSRKAGRR
jgi:hypothetical protein